MPLNPATIAELSTRLENKLGSAVYASWLGDGVFAEGINDQSLTLKVGSQFISTYVRQHYEGIITEEAAAVFGNPIRLTIIVDPFARPQIRTGAGGNAMPPAEIFRPVVQGGLDEQPDFFIPDVSEVPLKDDVSLMQVTPFTIQARGETRTRLVYELKNNQTIIVAANPEHGLPTAFDYDIVLMMVSHLTEAMNRYREGRGDKPGRTFKPHVSDILKFARRGDGSRQVKELEAALDRLKGTTVKNVRGYTETDGRKVRGTIHWVSCEHCVDAEIHLYDKLFTEANMNGIPDGADFKDYLNPDSVQVIDHAKLEESLADAKPGERFQFVRTGYFTPDSKNPVSYTHPDAADE